MWIFYFNSLMKENNCFTHRKINKWQYCYRCLYVTISNQLQRNRHLATYETNGGVVVLPVLLWTAESFLFSPTALKKQISCFWNSFLFPFLHPYFTCSPTQWAGQQMRKMVIKWDQNTPPQYRVCHLSRRLLTADSTWKSADTEEFSVLLWHS